MILICNVIIQIYKLIILMYNVIILIYNMIILIYNVIILIHNVIILIYNVIILIYNLIINSIQLKGTQSQCNDGETAEHQVRERTMRRLLSNQSSTVTSRFLSGKHFGANLPTIIATAATAAAAPPSLQPLSTMDLLFPCKKARLFSCFIRNF